MKLRKNWSWMFFFVFLPVKIFTIGHCSEDWLIHGAIKTWLTVADGDAENENSIRNEPTSCVFGVDYKVYRNECYYMNHKVVIRMVWWCVCSKDSYARMPSYKCPLASATAKCKSNILTIQSHLLVEICSLLGTHLYLLLFHLD